MNDQTVVNWAKGCFRPKSRAASLFVWNPPTDLEKPNRFAYICDGFSLLRVELNHKVFSSVALPDPGLEYRWHLGWRAETHNPLKPDKVNEAGDQMLPQLQVRYGDPEAKPEVQLQPYLFETADALHRIFTALGEPAFCVDKRSLDLLDPLYVGLTDKIPGATYVDPLHELPVSRGRFTFRCGGPMPQNPLMVLDAAGVVLWAMRTDIKEPLHF